MILSSSRSLPRREDVLELCGRLVDDSDRGGRREAKDQKFLFKLIHHKVLAFCKALLIHCYILGWKSPESNIYKLYS